MAEFGYLAVVLAFAASCFALSASAVGARLGRAELTQAGRRGMLASGALTTLAMGVLLAGFVSHDFTMRYVAETSSRTTPLFYLVTGVWGGQAGSMLFWSWLLCAYAAMALLRPWRADAALMPWFTAVCAGVAGFFLFLVAFVTNPFVRITPPPFDGAGLNPLLQHPGMAFHPPTLYLGLTGMTIPFAFAMAALLSGRLDAGWIVASRRWLLVAWAALSLGLCLGGRWAYDVLGWGGYWGWDPVENAALMPWIAGTAFLHSVMVQERRGIFKVWNLFLIILTFGLTILGTFLTRAGLVSSVHSFAKSNIGPYFLVFTAVILLGSLALLYWRLPRLRSEAQVESVLSRESAFMANNVLFLGALFGVFWGTLFPLVSEIVTGQRTTTQAPYFNRVVMPVFGLAVLLMAVGPFVGWNRADGRRIARALLKPAVLSLAMTAGLWIAGVRHWVAVVGVSICLFALLATGVEFLRGIGARTARGEGTSVALARLFQRNRRRYGGYLVHLGVSILGIGVIVSTVYRQERDQTLAAGESMPIGGYEIVYLGSTTSQTGNEQAVYAHLEVRRGGTVWGHVAPYKSVVRQREDQPMTIPSVLHLPHEDVYTLLGTFTAETGRATFKVFVNPLIGLVWLGMFIIVAGTLTAAWPDRAESRVLNAELQRLLASAEAPA